MELPALHIGKSASVLSKVSADKLVPALYPESSLYQEMPPVLATGFMIGLMEWAAIEILHPCLQPAKISLGTDVAVSHEKATIEGAEVIAEATVASISGKTVTFDVVVRENDRIVGVGTHRRVIVDRQRFEAKLGIGARGTLR